MIQVRKGTFETNSSSTHSICISKDPLPETLPKEIVFQVGEYGWETDTVEDTASYFYTAIMCETSESEVQPMLDKLKAICEKHGIHAVFVKPKKDRYGFSGYIDHGNELRPFIDDALENEDLLLRFLCNPASVVYTGNDNSDYDSQDRKDCIAREDIWFGSDENNRSIFGPHPDRDDEKFDYFFKGN